MSSPPAGAHLRGKQSCLMLSFLSLEAVDLSTSFLWLEGRGTWEQAWRIGWEGWRGAGGSFRFEWLQG